VMLFSYYLVLNAGIVAIAWVKAWRVLNVLGFAFTFVIGALWGAKAYVPEHFATTEPFLIAYFAMYVAIPILFARRRAVELKDYVDGTLVFGVPIVAFGLQTAMVRNYEYGAAFSALGLGAAYLVLATALFRRTSGALRLLVEGFIEGWEFALEGVMHHGALNALALFDKPDPLDGPYFDDSIYVTPSLAPEPMQWDILDAISRATTALGLHHGPVHAECRVGDRGVFVLGIAARPLASGWARALRFQKDGTGPKISYEELVLRHALGEAADLWRRETEASGAKRTGSEFTYSTGASPEDVERMLRAAG